LIVVFGSLNADLVFETEQAPAPGQTLLAKGFRIEAGGKGANQAVAAARAGGRVAMVGTVGHDALSHVAVANLADADIDVSRLARSQSATGCASIMVDQSGQNQIAVALGANLATSADQIDDALLSKADLVLFQMESRPEEITQVLRRAAGRGVRTMLNLAPAIRLDAETLRLCSYLVVNEDEAEMAAGWLGCEPTARSLGTTLSITVIRTLGSKGAEASAGDTSSTFQRARSHRSIPSRPVIASSACWPPVFRRGCR